jgi:hypothetical protein
VLETEGRESVDIMVGHMAEVESTEMVKNSCMKEDQKTDLTGHRNRR